MKSTRLLMIAAIAAFVLSCAGAAMAEGNRLPSYDPAVTPYKTAPWIDGTHLFDEMARRVLDQYGPPDYVPSSRKRSPKAVGKVEEFYVMNVESNQPEKRSAVLRKISKHCYLYVEEDREYKDAVLQNISDRFDNVIYKLDTETFGSEPKPGIDNDERITILMVDIRDGWAPGKGYVGGYFFPLDCYSTNTFKYSNEREMIYLDCYPSNPEDPFYLGVIAHEFQHMIHFANDPKEGKWLNEGCAQLAFFVCGYDHPSQILSYIAKPSHPAASWSNTLEDYGAVYLFNYYLFQKYAGKTLADKKNFYRKLVASQLKDAEGVDEALKNAGTGKTFEEIFRDWTVANLINRPELGDGRYGYDKTLTMRVHTTHEATALPFKIEKAELPDHGVANIMFAPFVTHLPQSPTLIEKFKVFSRRPATLVWGVNGWRTPDEKYLPAGSLLAGGLAETRLAGPGADGLYSAEFGPMAGAGRVDEFNFRYRYEDGAVSADSLIDIIGPAGRNAGLSRAEEKTALCVRFKGEKGTLFNKDKKFVLTQIVEDRDGRVAVGEVPLKDGEAAVIVPAYGTSIAKVYLIAYPIGAKKMKFDLEASLLTPSEAEGVKGAFTMKPEWLAASGVSQDPVVVKNSKGAKSQAPSVSSQTGEARAELSAAVRRSDSDDTSHENFGYLVWKLNDNLHLLTHLKIDPVLIEGQILQMYKMLQITMNLPNLPLPDGLAIKDYNCSTMLGWAAGLNETTGSAKDREALKRIINAAPALEGAYNASLMLTDDVFESVWSVVQFTFRSVKIVNNVASGLANVPVVGALADKAKYKIRAKLIEVLNNGAVLIAPHLPPKFGSLLPTGVWVLTTIYCGVTHTQLDSGGINGNVGFIVKLFGKYLMASLPKIGFVDRTQRSIDALGAAAIGHKFEGSLEECNRFVEAKSNFIAGAVAEAKNIAAKDRQIANLTGNLSQLAVYASAIDPTVISKVAAIALGVTTGGFYAHSIYVPFREYLKTDDYMNNIVDLQMFGREIPAAAKARPLSGKKFDPADADADLESFMKACGALNEKIASGADARAVSAAFDGVLAADEKLEGSLSIARAMLSAAGAPAEGENGIFSLVADFDQFALAQASYYGDVVAYAAGSTKSVARSGGQLKNAAAKLSAAFGRNRGKALYKACAIESVSFPSDVEEGREFTIRTVVSNISSDDDMMFTATLELPNIIAAKDKTKKYLSIYAGDYEIVEFKVKALAPLYDDHESAIMLTVAASGDEQTVANSRIAYIRVKPKK